MARRRASHFSGYTAYRYGNARPISLAGQRPRVEVLPASRRDAIIVETMAILDGGQSSKFQFEGACRHGVRAGLCLDGFTYGAADGWSERIVGEALRRIGAARPTWSEGQPEWTQNDYTPVDRLDCERCGKPMPDDAGQRFCSELCRRAAASLRHARLRRVCDAAERAALAAASNKARRDATLLRKTNLCEVCGTVFEGARRQSRFCSLKCAGASRRTRNRVCVRCGKPFVAKRSDGKYCTFACAVEAQRKPLPPLAERACGWCGNKFMPSRKDAFFCKTNCTRNARRKRKDAPAFICEAAE